MAQLRRPALKGAASLLRQRSLSEGLWNGRKGWLAVGAVVWGARGVRYALRREERVLLREVLQPGETMVVRQVPTKAPKAKGAAKAKPQSKKHAEPRSKKQAKKHAEPRSKKQAKKDAKEQAKVKVKPAKVSRKDRTAIKRAAQAAA